MNRSAFRELVTKNRTCRRFQQKLRVTRSTLFDLVDLARLAPSGGNLQPLKYVLSCDPKQNARIFPCLAWAGYLPEWPGPAEGERPAAYIVMLADTAIGKGFDYDCGIAAQTIMLGATERGMGGCMIGSIERKRLRRILKIPARYEILLVLALGRPKETVVVEKVKGGNIKYWRDEKGGHHVPKRSLSDLIIR